MVRGRPRLGADGREEDEALGARPLRRARQADRGLGVEHAIIVFRQTRHGVGEAGGMNDRIDVGQRRRHVLRPREVADDGARGVHRHHARASQQDAQPVAALGQFPQQALPDEAGRSGEGDREVCWPRRRGSLLLSGILERALFVANISHWAPLRCVRLAGLATGWRRISV